MKVYVENYMTSTTRHVASAYLTFVAVDQHGIKQPVPPIVPESEEEKHRYADAERRREHRKIEMAHKQAKKKA